MIADERAAFARGSAGRHVFRERVGSVQLIGVALILIGLYLAAVVQ